MASKPLHTKLREKRNRPPGPFVWFTREMLESYAMAAMSPPALRIILRVCIEHIAHAGSENGNLDITYDAFVKYGVRRSAIRSGIATAVALGFLIVTREGKPSAGNNRWPTCFALGWLPMYDGVAARNGWKRFESLQHARDTVSSAIAALRPRRPSRPSPSLPTARVIPLYRQDI